jgi:hypothetical protein
MAKADGKLNTEKALALGLCWNEAQCDEFAAKMEASGFHQGDEYTVAQLLSAKHIEYDDAMWAVCREAVTPTKVLRDFAALVAADALKIVAINVPSPVPFQKAVAFLQEGDADERSAELAEHSEAVQKFMVGVLVPVSDDDEPEKIATYARTMQAAKGVRAALKPKAGDAAYAAAHHAYSAVKGSARNKIANRHRGQLATLYRKQA